MPDQVVNGQNFYQVTPAGIEPASSESESEILSIVLRGQKEGIIE